MNQTDSHLQWDFYGSEAYGINASGQVVGRAFSIPDTFRAIIWQNGKMSSLGTGLLSTALGINSSGQVVGQGSGSGFLWQNGTITQLGLGGSFGINDSGQIVGVNNSGAYLWQNGTFTQLGPGSAHAINAGGQIAGFSNSHAVLWQNGTVTDLGTLGGSLSIANGINASGAVVGWSRIPGDPGGDKGAHAFLWQNGTMADLGAGFANAINGPGLVVGQSSQQGPAVLWQSGMLSDLNTLIPADSGWMLEDATSLNDAGQIVGHGFHNGVSRGFLLTPNQAPVPEPSTLLLLGIGMLGTIAWTLSASRVCRNAPLTQVLARLTVRN